MKMKLNLIIISLILVSLITACSEPAAPTIQKDLLTYTVEGSDTSLKVDVTYMSDTGIIKLSDQSLPWTVTLEIDENFISDAYLKAEIPQNEVFMPYISGTTDAVPENRKLHDADANFINGGVAIGDIVYNDPSTLEFTAVRLLDDADSLTIDSDLFKIGNENYYLYKVKTLSATVDLDGTVVENDTAESERSLSCLVQTPLEY